MKSTRKSVSTFLTALLGAGTLAFAADAFSVVRVVDGNDAPWLSSPSLNSDYAYGVGTPGAPVVIDGVDLPGFAPGLAVTISYLAGTVSVFPAEFPFVDAAGNVVTPNTGYAGPVNGEPGSGAFFPSLDMPADWDVNLGALVGTFADAAGVVVGTPFEVGLGRTLTIPVGATRLQLGINDDVFGDNGGSFTVNAVLVPEPQTYLLLGIGLVCVAALCQRKSREGKA
jgi:hypothetical protein